MAAAVHVKKHVRHGSPHSLGPVVRALAESVCLLSNTFAKCTCPVRMLAWKRMEGSAAHGYVGLYRPRGLCRALVSSAPCAQGDFERIASFFSMLDDWKDGIPRASYRGVVRPWPPTLTWWVACAGCGLACLSLLTPAFDSKSNLASHNSFVGYVVSLERGHACAHCMYILRLTRYVGLRPCQ